MIAGEFKVFSGEIKYNDGSVLCKEGQELTNEANLADLQGSSWCNSGTSK